MTDSDSDDLSTFKKFIEESLDLAGLGNDHARHSTSNSPRFNPNLSNYPMFKQDVRRAWNALHDENPGEMLWAFHLTPLELETHGVLQEMILEAVLKRCPAQPNKDDMRTIVAYTMSLSWLMLRALEEKYGVDDGDNSIIDLNDLDF